MNYPLTHGFTLLHFCARSGCMSLAEELVRRGADMDLADKHNHTPLCVAPYCAHLPTLRYFPAQYQARGAEELESAIACPCRGDQGFSLLAHVVEGSRHNDPAAHLTMARYLVEECGADIWEALWKYKTFIKIGDAKVPMSIAFLPLHSAAYRGALALLRFFLEECQMPVDTVVGTMKPTPLHAACMNPGDERDVLQVVRYLVLEKGGDITLRTGTGKTVADLARMSGKQQIL